jgi:hypothetical protein
MAAMDDIEAQRKGTCILMYFIVAALSAPSFVRTCTELALRTGHLIANCIPGRFTSMHFLYDDPRLEFFTSTIRLAVGSQTRLRLRTHLGEWSQEFLFGLETGCGN